jgi:hypothetical protein
MRGSMQAALTRMTALLMERVSWEGYARNKRSVGTTDAAPKARPPMTTIWL